MPAIDLPPQLWLPPKPAIIRPAEVRRADAVLRKASLVPVFVPVRNATVALTAHPTSASDASSYTFSSASIGAASFDRIVIVGVSVQAGSIVTISSLSIGGNNAAVQANVDAASGGQSNIGAIYSLLVPSGTTADIVVTLSAGAVRCAIAVWATTGLRTATASATATNSATSSQSSLGASLDILGGGVGIGYVCCTINGGGTMGDITWTNLTEDVDETFEAANCKQGAASSAPNPGASLTRTANFAATTPNRIALALAAFR
jgi:hypothetical protein